MITLSGMSRFRIRREVTGFSPYQKADVNWSDFSRDLGKEEEDPDFDREPFLKLLTRYFEAAGLQTDWGSLEEADDELLVNSLSMLCPFSLEEKQALLEAPHLTDRRETLTALMEFTCRGGGAEEVIQ
jgi:Lon protease-like protein